MLVAEVRRVTVSNSLIFLATNVIIQCAAAAALQSRSGIIVVQQIFRCLHATSTDSLRERGRVSPRECTDICIHDLVLASNKLSTTILSSCTYCGLTSSVPGIRIDRETVAKIRRIFFRVVLKKYGEYLNDNFTSRAVMKMMKNSGYLLNILLLV